MTEVPKPPNDRAMVWRALPYRLDTAERAVIETARRAHLIGGFGELLEAVDALERLLAQPAPRPEPTPPTPPAPTPWTAERAYVCPLWLGCKCLTSVECTNRATVEHPNPSDGEVTPA